MTINIHFGHLSKAWKFFINHETDENWERFRRIRDRLNQRPITKSKAFAEAKRQRIEGLLNQMAPKTALVFD